jgi:phospholipid/cholesterol/gamma-HCH transport system ATP-binding protein
MPDCIAPPAPFSLHHLAWMRLVVKGRQFTYIVAALICVGMAERSGSIAPEPAGAGSPGSAPTLEYSIRGEPPAACGQPDCYLVEIKNLTLHFGQKMVFDHFNLEIRRGECLVLLGPSGIGKSTLLRLLLSTLRPESGTIRFDGKDITVLSGEKLNRLRARIGMVFQSSALISSLSVFENLALPLRELATKTEPEIQAIVEEKLRFVDLEQAKYLMPAELSGGMKKRVAVARSLVMEPDLILFDEPTTGLDPIVAHHVNELILNLNRKAAVTTLVVTHDLHTAFYVANRIAMLNEGKIVELGSPAALRKSRNPVVVQFLKAALAESSLAPDPDVEA